MSADPVAQAIEIAKRTGDSLPVFAAVEAASPLSHRQRKALHAFVRSSLTVARPRGNPVFQPDEELRTLSRKAVRMIDAGEIERKSPGAAVTRDPEMQKRVNRYVDNHIKALRAEAQSDHKQSTPPNTP